ncbi:MAG TPA: hypothetical protein PLN22_06385, partial [Ignavibacteria bacterium]|nr:hypothetical protein [Ignavibacteria bacterium]
MKSRILLLSALFLICSASLTSQTKLNLTVFGGYTMPVADLKGSYPDTMGANLLNFDKPGTLLTSGGFNIGAIGKY